MKTNWIEEEEAAEEQINKMDRAELVHYLETARGFECYGYEYEDELRSVALQEIGIIHVYNLLIEVRDAFWRAHPEFNRIPGQRQNDYDAEIRSQWVVFVDVLSKDRSICAALADSVTL